MKRWAEQVEGLVGSLAGKRVGIDIWDLNMEAAIRAVFPKTEFADGYQKRAHAREGDQDQDEIIASKLRMRSPRRRWIARWIFAPGGKRM